MLIKGYGEYWSPDHCSWGEQGRSAGSLKGYAKGGEAHFAVDVWEAMAIYVLWDNYIPVYIGKAGGGNRGLGPRLRDHRRDRLRGRWDLFSFYSLSKPLKSGGVQKNVGNRKISASDALAAFEAFGQRLELPLNRRMESLADAIPIEQVIDVDDEVHVLEALEAIDERLETIKALLEGDQGNGR